MSKVYSGTNRAKVVAIMNDNASLSREACIELIAQLGDMPYETAKAGYQRAVRLGLAAGEAKPTKAKKDKLVEAAKREGREYAAAKAKLVRAGLTKAVAKADKAIAKVEKSAVEVADIKAKNLAKLREVSSKHKKYNQMARPEGEGVENFDADEARAYVDSVYADLDNFKAPAKLTRDEVKYLV